MSRLLLGSEQEQGVFADPNKSTEHPEPDPDPAIQVSQYDRQEMLQREDWILSGF